MFQMCYYHQHACLLVCLPPHACLSSSQTSVDDSGHKGNAGQLLNSRVLHGCAVINNLIYDSSFSLSVSVKVLVCTHTPPFCRGG